MHLDLANEGVLRIKALHLLSFSFFKHLTIAQVDLFLESLKIAVFLMCVTDSILIETTPFSAVIIFFVSVKFKKSYFVAFLLVDGL